jgi:hypothetical protein
MSFTKEAFLSDEANSLILEYGRRSDFLCCERNQIVSRTNSVKIERSNFLYVYGIAPKLQRNGGCDPSDPTACQTTSRLSRIVLWCSTGLYLVGCFSAYVLGPLLVGFDS